MPTVGYFRSVGYDYGKFRKDNSSGGEGESSLFVGNSSMSIGSILFKFIGIPTIIVRWTPVLIKVMKANWCIRADVKINLESML